MQPVRDDPHVAALLLGLGLGFANGIAPGPTMALIVSTTLARGWRAGMQVAIAPLLTDVPIVLVAVLIAGTLPSTGLALLGVAGAGVLAWFAWEAIRAAREVDVTNLQSARAGGRDWVRGAAANILNPAPWLFWATVGGPVLASTSAESGIAGAIAFLVGFYVAIIGAKLAVAAGLAASRHRLSTRAYRILLTGSAVMLIAFAVTLAGTAVRTLVG